MDGEAGRYCLNDLHRASVGHAKDQPGRFLRSREARALSAEIQETTQIRAVSSEEGRTGGTYVAKELVYAYAMWISPKFALKVIRTYDAFMEAALRGAPKGNINNNPAAKAEKSIAINRSQLTSAEPAQPKRAPETRKKLAEKAGVSERKAQQALHVVRKASPAVNAAVRAGEMSLKDAVKTLAPAKPKAKPISVDRLDSDDDYLKEIESLACKELVPKPRPWRRSATRSPPRVQRSRSVAG